MNILEVENLVKGMPDQQLMQEAQQPSGQVPQFLTISEIQRRADMRKRFEAQQQQPQGTVADQIMQQGIGAMQQQPQQGMPQQPPMGMAYGGQVRGMAAGGRTMWVNDGYGRMVEIDASQYPNQLAAYESMWAGTNPPIGMEQGNFRPAEDQTLQFDPQGNLITDMGGGSRPTVSLGAEPIAQNDGFDWQGVGLSLSGTVDKWNRGIASLLGHDPDMPDAERYARTREAVRMSPKGPSPFRNITPEEINATAAENTNIFSNNAKQIANFTLGAGREGAGLDPLFDVDLSHVGSPGSSGGSDSKAEQLAAASGAAQKGVKTPGGIGDLMGPPPPDGLTDEATDTRSALERLLEMADRDYPKTPDFKDLIKQANKDAFNNALIQFGAGIASDDVGGGIQRAGIAAMQGRETAREMDARSRLLGYKAQTDDLARDIEVYGQAAVVEASYARNEVERMQNQGYSDREILRFVDGLVEQALDGVITIKPEDRQKAVMDLYRMHLPEDVMQRLRLQGLLERRAPGGEGGGGGVVDWKDL